MSRNILGIDFGSSTLKLALYDGKVITSLYEEQMPDKLVRGGTVVSPEALSSFIKDTVKKLGISAKRVAIVAPVGKAFVLRTSIPPMTVSQLKINLPYEFRDFISEDKDKYFYDYAVVKNDLKSDGTLEKLQIFATAVDKETIAQYRDICRWAGLKLVTVLPPEFALINVLRAYEASLALPDGSANDSAPDNTAAPTEPAPPIHRCIVDLGHSACRAFFFGGDDYKAATSIEKSGAILDDMIANAFNVDIHIARAHKETNLQGELDSESMHDFFDDTVRELQRAINFYNYSNPDADLSEVWLAGGLSRIAAISDSAADILGDNTAIKNIADMLGNVDKALAPTCVFAIGAAIQ